MRYKRQKATKVKCKCDYKTVSIVEYILLKIKIVSFTAGARSQKNTKPYQNLLNPMITGLVK